jgi:hypothetical protein
MDADREPSATTCGDCVIPSRMFCLSAKQSKSKSNPKTQAQKSNLAQATSLDTFRGCANIMQTARGKEAVAVRLSRNWQGIVPSFPSCLSPSYFGRRAAPLPGYAKYESFNVPSSRHERPTRLISKAKASGWGTGSTFCSQGPDRQLAYRL